MERAGRRFPSRIKLSDNPDFLVASAIAPDLRPPNAFLRTIAQEFRVKTERSHSDTLRNFGAFLREQHGAGHLTRALGDTKTVLGFLLDQATEYQKPIGVNRHSGHGSTASFIAPRGWTEERLKGWIATAKPLLEQEFGDVSAAPKRLT